MRQQLTAIEADKNRLYGSVAQAVNVIEEKYGAYKEVALNDQSYESYVRICVSSMKILRRSIVR